MKNKKLYISLLDHLLQRADIDSIHRVKAHNTSFTMYQTTKNGIIIEYAGDFCARARDYPDALRVFSEVSNRKITHEDMVVISTEIPEKNVDDVKVLRGNRMVSQVDKDFFPKRFSVKTGVIVGDRAFYIVKKNPLGKALKHGYNVYSYTSRLLVFSHNDRDICVAWLKMHYDKIKELDYE